MNKNKADRSDVDDRPLSIVDSTAKDECDGGVTPTVTERCSSVETLTWSKPNPNVQNKRSSPFPCDFKPLNDILEHRSMGFCASLQEAR